MMKSVINIVDNYIKESKKYLENNDEKNIEKMIDKIINTFENEIPKITDRISSYIYFSNSDIHNDLLILIDRLELYKAKLQDNKIMGKGSNAITINNTNNNINSITNTNELLNEIENQIYDACLGEELTKEVLEKVNELIDTLESKDKKSSKWNIIKNVFSWSIDKGLQVAAIILPLISKFN